MTEDAMVGCHHRLTGHEFEQTQGDSEGQQSLACCSPWGRKESDTTEHAHTYTHTHHCGSASVNSSSLERCEEKAMATHSSVLAWRIPGMGEPGGLPSMGSHRVRHD